MTEPPSTPYPKKIFDKPLTEEQKTYGAFPKRPMPKCYEEI